MSATKISWATHTVNWLAGCSHTGPECDNCYAETMSQRLVNMGGPDRYAGAVEDWTWTGEINYDPEALFRAFDGLRDARKPRRVFVNSMSDTFHDGVPVQAHIDLAREIRRLEQSRMAGKPLPHVIMLLTKRPENMSTWQREFFPLGLPSWVWVGVTAGNQRSADIRVPKLLQVNAAVRFVSVEPMLGAVDLGAVKVGNGDAWCPMSHNEHGDEMCHPGLDWIVCGGESGPQARPMHPDWARSLRDQCKAAAVPFLFKQWGEYAPIPEPNQSSPIQAKPPLTVNVDGFNMNRRGKKAAGRLLDGEQHHEFPAGNATTQEMA